MFYCWYCPQPQKSPPKKAKPALNSSSDEEPPQRRVARTGRAKAPVKYFNDSEDENSDDKENDNTNDWLLSASDFEDDWGIMQYLNVLHRHLFSTDWFKISEDDELIFMACYFYLYK